MELSKICTFCGQEYTCPQNHGNRKYCGKGCQFMGSFDVTKTNRGYCWLVFRNKTSAGYGQLSDKKYSHIYSYETYRGPIQKNGSRGDLVQHFCNTPNCVNPAHLSVGSQKTNMEYASACGRIPRGEKNKKAKLTNDQAREIRKLYHSETFSGKELAKMYGVSSANISFVVNNKTYRE
jgi:hypothetical protein